MMKYIPLLCIVFLVSCSKCYDCTEVRDIYDANGNVIDQQEVTDEVCTASSSEITDREANGATCQ
jgi:hypothetical protein